MIHEHQPGVFSVALRPCTMAVVGTFLRDTDFTVWIRGHLPVETIRWWTASVPLRESADSVACRVRNLTFDLEMPSCELVRLLPEFEHAGAELYVMDRTVPHTLTLEGLSHESLCRVLRANGWVAFFDLPHAHEVAVLSAPRRETLESWLESTALREWIQE